MEYNIYKLIEIKMNYREILEKSFQSVKKYRYLWGLGFLAMLAQFGNGFSGYNFDTNNFGNGRSIENMNYDSVSHWINLHEPALIMFSILSLLVLIAIIYLSLRAQAGQIFAIKKIEEDKPFKTFHQAFDAGRGYSWKMFLLGLLVTLAVLVWGAVTIFLPIMIIALVPSIIVYIFCGALIFAGAIGGLLLIFVFSISYMYSLRIMVLSKKPVIESFEDGIRLVKKNLGDSILALLIQFLINMVVALGIGLILLIVGGILALIGWGVFASLGAITTIVYSVALGIPFIGVAWLIGAILNSFYSSYWTLIYLKLKK